MKKVKIVYLLSSLPGCVCNKSVYNAAIEVEVKICSRSNANIYQVVVFNASFLNTSNSEARTQVIEHSHTPSKSEKIVVFLFLGMFVRRARLNKMHLVVILGAILTCVAQATLATTPPVPPVDYYQLEIWRNLYDFSDGPSWIRCRDSRNSPCTCTGSRDAFVLCTNVEGVNFIKEIVLRNNNVALYQFPETSTVDHTCPRLDGQPYGIRIAVLGPP